MLPRYLSSADVDAMVARTAPALHELLAEKKINMEIVATQRRGWHGRATRNLNGIRCNHDGYPLPGGAQGIRMTRVPSPTCPAGHHFEQMEEPWWPPLCRSGS